MEKVRILMPQIKVDRCLRVVSKTPAHRYLSKSVGVTVPRSVIRPPQIKCQKNMVRSNVRSEGIVSSESNKINSKRQILLSQHSKLLTLPMH